MSPITAAFVILMLLVAGNAKADTEVSNNAGTSGQHNSERVEIWREPLQP